MRQPGYVTQSQSSRSFFQGRLSVGCLSACEELGIFFHCVAVASSLSDTIISTVDNQLPSLPGKYRCKCIIGSMIFTGGWVCDGLRMLDLFDGQVNKYSKVLAPKTTLTSICVKSVRYKDQECTEKYGLNVIFKGIVLTSKQTKTTTPSRKCCQLIFSSLSSYSTHKRRTLSSCETTLPASDFPPPECQLFYICSTMQLVDVCEFETGNHQLLTFWKGTSMYHQVAFQP